ncbi:hypothetical protein [Photobacterium leiognathi]|uniref:hypothetical protein n=1 Tax=Photobacterium leiognathi TaxID=553611 RepID=UPI0029823860|nr:hypothetical protein [Photobacterium leiognathi]
MKIIVSLLLLCMFTSYAFASEMRGRLRVDDGFQPISLETLKDGIAPAIWDTPAFFPAVNSIILGGPVKAGEVKQLQLSNRGGDRVNIPITPIGMQFMLSADPIGVSSVSGISATTTLAGNMATVIGNGAGDKVIHLSDDVGITPATHVRPILTSIDSEEMLKRFQEKNLRKGKYSGELSIEVPYDYYATDGIKKRYVQVLKMRFVVDYNPASIVLVQIDKQPVINPNYYDYPDVKVGGETNVNVSVRGDLASGLKLGLRHSSSAKGYYSMQHTLNDTTGSEKDIPYFVNCVSGCLGGNKSIINVQGIAQINNGSERLDTVISSDGESADIRLNVGFRDIPLDELKAGEYQGSFTLVFEAML